MGSELWKVSPPEAVGIWALVARRGRKRRRGEIWCATDQVDFGILFWRARCRRLKGSESLHNLPGPSTLLTNTLSCSCDDPDLSARPSDDVRTSVIERRDSAAACTRHKDEASVNYAPFVALITLNSRRILRQGHPASRLARRQWTLRSRIELGKVHRLRSWCGFDGGCAIRGCDSIVPIVPAGVLGVAAGGFSNPEILIREGDEASPRLLRPSGTVVLMLVGYV